MVERMNDMEENKDDKKYENRFAEITNVETMKEQLIPEEFPDGPFGSPIRKNAKVEGKSSQWIKGQQRTSGYVYYDKERHDDLPRQMPGAHPLHDE